MALSRYLVFYYILLVGNLGTEKGAQVFSKSITECFIMHIQGKTLWMGNYLKNLKYRLKLGNSVSTLLFFNLMDDIIKNCKRTTKKKTSEKILKYHNINFVKH